MTIFRKYFAQLIDFYVLNSKALKAALVLILAIGLAPALHGQTIRIAHCVMGCPLGSPTTNDVIVRPIYTLSFNHQTRVADWVTYVVTSGSIGVATNLSREPQQDPYINNTLRQEDYDNSVDVLKLERNAFAPLISFAGTPFWSDVNYLTNMVPRNPDLNRGSWYGLEWAVRNLANRTDLLYVITGPIFDPEKLQQSLLTEVQHVVPSGFFKIVATKGGQVAAFTFDQDLPFYVHHCEQLTTLENVERLTGLDLFPEVAGWPVGDLSPRLGCF